MCCHFESRKANQGQTYPRSVALVWQVWRPSSTWLDCSTVFVNAFDQCGLFRGRREWRSQSNFWARCYGTWSFGAVYYGAKTSLFFASRFVSIWSVLASWALVCIHDLFLFQTQVAWPHADSPPTIKPAHLPLFWSNSFPLGTRFSFLEICWTVSCCFSRCAGFSFQSPSKCHLCFLAALSPILFFAKVGIVSLSSQSLNVSYLIHSWKDFVFPTWTSSILCRCLLAPKLTCSFISLG